VLAVRRHPLAAGRRERGRDHQLARRPFPVPAGLHRRPARVGRRCRGHVQRGRRRARWPAATLTDNGAVYTSRFTGGRNGFEYLLAYLGIRQKNGAPGHPQTQGKIERFQQTLKRWLGRQPAPRTIAELQRQLDAFRTAYNEQRPHRAVGRSTPGEAYRAMPKALPAGSRAGAGHFRLRYDITDSRGAMTLRRAGRLYHLKIGAAHARRRVLAIVDEREVTVVALDTGEVLSSHLIEPERRYWRNQRRDPGRWPGSQATS
jgi:hypothetical protein